MVYALIFWAFFVLFMKLPIWIRLPFLFVSGLQLTRLAVRRLLHAFDQEPDFSIGPDGIGGLDRTGFHVIPWNEVKSVTVHGPNIEVRGQEHGPRRFFDTLPPRRLSIGFSQHVFKVRKAEVLDAIRHFRPDIDIHEVKVNYWRF